jgi:hypothetical protein
VNPNVTRAAQRELAKKLHAEVALEKDLDRAFLTRPPPTSNRDQVQDNAKIFNDFCIEFIETSKVTKEHVVQVLDDAHARMTELDELQARLEEVERRNYQFEMNLPDAPRTVDNEIDRAISEEAGEIKKKKETT